jgi:hypothetical protein
MITAAISQPTEDFDGKIGLFPYIINTQAARNSANRPRGAPVLSNINVDNASFYEQQTREIDGVIHTIKNKMLYQDINNPIKIQMDNAPAHVGLDVVQDLQDYVDLAHLNISWEMQPPNSPDLNICDLAFFNALQKATDRLKRRSGSTTDLLQAVQ